MKMRLKIFLPVMIFGLIVSCNKDPVQKGDEAFESDRLLDAQKYYQEALKQNPGDTRIKEKLLATYFKTGKYFYETKKLVTSFEGQVKQGFAYLPEPIPDSLKKDISVTLLDLARAFREAPADNDYQKEEFLQKSIYYLKTALEYDSANSAVLNDLQKINENEIEGILQKGNAYYQAGQKEAENYFKAQSYFLEALELDPINEEAIRNLRLTRKKLLGVYDYEQFTPLKIIGKSTIDELLVYEIKILNNTNRVMDLKGDGFSLISADGSKLGGFFSEQFSMPYLTKKLTSGQEAKGVVSFDPEPGKRYVRLEYDGGGKFKGHKIFP